MEVYKTLGLPLSTITLQSKATQAIISINISICFKYYTVLSHFFN